MKEVKKLPTIDLNKPYEVHFMSVGLEGATREFFENAVAGYYSPPELPKAGDTYQIVCTGSKRDGDLKHSATFALVRCGQK